MKCRLISDDFSETSNAMDDAQSIEGKQIVCDAKCRICVKDIFGYFLLFCYTIGMFEKYSKIIISSMF